MLDDFYELKALHGTICEAKFHPDSYRKEIQGSPLVARTANKVYDLLIAASRTEKEAEYWTSHRNLRDNYSVFPFIESKARETFENFPDWSREERTVFLRDLAAPFVLSNELLLRLLRDH